MKDRIKQVRKHFALTQEQFAKRIGKTTGYISNIEKGRCGMSRSAVSSVCAAFGISEEWLRQGVGEMFASEKNVDQVRSESVGSRLRAIRNREKLTQAKLADRIGYHKNHITNIENGKYIPSDRFLAKVGREFGVSVDWLKTGEADERDPVDDRLMDWLRKNPEIARELRVRAGLD